MDRRLFDMQSGTAGPDQHLRKSREVLVHPIDQIEGGRAVDPEPGRLVLDPQAEGDAHDDVQGSTEEELPERRALHACAWNEP